MMAGREDGVWVEEGACVGERVRTGKSGGRGMPGTFPQEERQTCLKCVKVIIPSPSQISDKISDIRFSIHCCHCVRQFEASIPRQRLSNVCTRKVKCLLISLIQKGLSLFFLIQDIDLFCLTVKAEHLSNIFIICASYLFPLIRYRHRSELVLICSAHCSAQGARAVFSTVIIQLW